MVFNKKKQPELKKLKDTPEKGDALAMIIAAFITLVLPITIMIAVIYGLIYLIFR